MVAHAHLTILAASRIRPWAIWLVTISVSVTASHRASAEEVHRFVSTSATIEGRAIFWDAVRSELSILARDGRLWHVPASHLQKTTPVAGPFQGLSQGQMRAELIHEYGPGFDTTGTGHYLVVHPAGQKDQWAARFEALYRQSLVYFSVRGIAVQEPIFPLVAVVYPTQEAFLAGAQRAGVRLSSQVLGYYDSLTNRILLYDVTAGGRNPTDWQTNGETIIHEALHQTAFNVGIHSRFTPPPRWLAEGLATMFEAPGVYDSRNHPELRDRIQFTQRKAFSELLNPGPPKGLVPSLIIDDEIFGQYPSVAYATSWALVTMLAEQEPQKLGLYLRRTAQKPPFQEVTPEARMQDFVEVFGTSFEMLESRLVRFVQELPQE